MAIKEKYGLKPVNPHWINLKMLRNPHNKLIKI